MSYCAINLIIIINIFIAEFINSICMYKKTDFGLQVKYDVFVPWPSFIM